VNLAVIIARGGSKRIPKKNIRNFCGQPMISWSIKAAKKSKCFDKIIVSTDDQEIANISKTNGAEIPFIRPRKLADDFSTTQDVVKHAIKWFEENNFKLELVCCIYAAAPLISYKDIQKAIRLISDSKTNTFIFPATTYQYPIQRSLKINTAGYAQMYYPDNFFERSQDLEEAFHDSGQFYLASKNAWKNVQNIFTNSKPILIPRWRVEDIDTEEDLKNAEIKAKILKTQEDNNI